MGEGGVDEVGGGGGVRGGGQYGKGEQMPPMKPCT